MSSLASGVSGLQSDVSALQNEVSALQSGVSDLDNRVTNLEAAPSGLVVYDRVVAVAAVAPDQTLVDSQEFTLVWDMPLKTDTVIEETGGGIFTAREDGWFRINANVRLDGVALNTKWFLSIVKNGTDVELIDQSSRPGGSPPFIKLNGDLAIQLNENDTVELRILAYGGPENFQISQFGGGSPVHNLSIERIA